MALCDTRCPGRAANTIAWLAQYAQETSTSQGSSFRLCETDMWPNDINYLCLRAGDMKFIYLSNIEKYIQVLEHMMQAKSTTYRLLWSRVDIPGLSPMADQWDITQCSHKTQCCDFIFPK